MCHFDRVGGFVIDGRGVFLHPVRVLRVLGYGAARFCVREGIFLQMFGTNALWAWEGCLKSTHPKTKKKCTKGLWVWEVFGFRA